MPSQVTRWGNSLGIRIPAPIAKLVHLEEGTGVTFTVVDDALVIRPQKRKKYNLDDLLEGMTPDNFHAEIDMGVPVGNEIW
jgi:antitoxin MazE